MRQPFPLFLAIASILATWLGILAAVLGIKWGTAPTPGDALPLAWLYVHLMLALTWLIIWPALALRPGAIASAEPADVFWNALAIALGALPAVIVAGFLSRASPNAVGLMLALQAASALLAAGIITCRQNAPRLAAWSVTLLLALTLAGPIFAFVAVQFYPHAAGPWLNAAPLMAIAHAATSVHNPADARALWATACAQMLCGLLLMGINSLQEKAPGTQVPRA